MKLYEVPNNSMVRVLERVEGPPGGGGFEIGDELHFYKIDGMYSVCRWPITGTLCHLKAWTEVEIVN